MAHWWLSQKRAGNKCERIAMVLLGWPGSKHTGRNKYVPSSFCPDKCRQLEKPDGRRSRNLVFYKDGVKQTGWQTRTEKNIYLNADGTMKANEWMIDMDGSVLLLPQLGWSLPELQGKSAAGYTFGADSKVQGSQWVVKGGKWYLVKDGKIATGCFQTWDEINTT